VKPPLPARHVKARFVSATRLSGGALIIGPIAHTLLRRLSEVRAEDIFMSIAVRTCALLLVASLIIASPAIAQTAGLCSLFCLDSLCGRGGGCCEPGCGCEASCGCGSGCGVDGRQFAGQVWEGSGCNGYPSSCGCFQGNPHGCGCEPACGCASSCEPSCGCASGCQRQSGCCLGGGLFNCLFGCNGCDEEFYWCEWYNDPPRCCEPCDRCGNWIGPSAGYRAPYAHPYAAHSPMPYYANQRMSMSAFAKAPVQSRSSSVAARKVSPTANPRVSNTHPAHWTTRTAAQTQTPRASVAREPNSSLNRTIQR
jgi:hypothetical protein